MEPIEYLWKDRKRRLGMPLSFTRYALSEDRLFCEKGFLNLKSDEVLLYRVQDLELTMTLGQRLFGVGTVCVHNLNSPSGRVFSRHAALNFLGINPSIPAKICLACRENPSAIRRFRL